MPFVVRALADLPYPHAMARRHELIRGVSECPYSRDSLIQEVLGDEVPCSPEASNAAYADAALRAKANALCRMHRGDFHAAYAAAITLLDQYGHDDPRVADRFPELPDWAGLDVDTQRLAVALLDPDDPVRLHINSSESAIVGQHRTCFARSVGAREMILWTD